MTANGTGSLPALEVPDVLGDRGRAGMVAGLLLDWQRRAQELAQVQAANEHKDDDVVPGLPPGGDGKPVTYEDRFEDFDRQQAAVCEAFRDVLDVLRERLPELQRRFEGAGLL